jgi:hypothetical protein
MGNRLCFTMLCYQNMIMTLELYFLYMSLFGFLSLICVTGENAECVSFEAENMIKVVNEKKKDKSWEFDQVFDFNSTQNQVYSDVADLVVSVLDGYNVCIFAYGQTGSGKVGVLNVTLQFYFLLAFRSYCVLVLFIFVFFCIDNLRDRHGP